MERYQNYARKSGSDSAAIAPGATVTVYLSGTLTLATLYSDNGITPQANPFTADATSAFFHFYASDALYDVQISGTGVTTPYTWGAILLLSAVSSVDFFPEDYGAVGDGVTNDTDAFQDCDTACAAANGRIRLRGKNYKLGRNAVTVTSITDPLGSVYVVTTSTAHGFTTGDTIAITGNTLSLANGPFVITVTGASTFSLNGTSGTGGSSGTGGTAGVSFYLSKGVSIDGVFTLGRNGIGSGSEGSLLTGTTGIPVICLSVACSGGSCSSLTAGTYTVQGSMISGVMITGGYCSIMAANGAVYMQLDDVLLNSPTKAAIYTKGFNQEWFCKDVEMIGGEYGFYLPDEEGITKSAGGINYYPFLDKSFFESIYIHGQSVNGVYVAVQLSTHVVWRDIRLVDIEQDGILVGGQCNVWTFDTMSTETLGQTGTYTPTTTNGTVNSGATSFDVVSATDIIIGSTLTIKGAGASGVDLVSVVTNVVGVTITITNATSTTVTDTEVTIALYSALAFRLVKSGTQRTNVLFLNCNLQQGNAQKLRYTLDLSGASGTMTWIEGTASGRPIYDPNNNLNFLSGRAAGGLRRPNNFLSEDFNTTTLTPRNAECPRSMVNSPFGKDFVVGMVDSDGAGTGTFGNYEIRKYNSARTCTYRANATTGDIFPAGGVAPGLLATNGSTSAIGTQRIFYFTAAPTAGTFVKGDVVINSNPAVGQPIGWTCTVAGTPGTWVAWANL